MALSQRFEQLTLELEEPGGETLDRFLQKPMEMTQFLRLALRRCLAEWESRGHIAEVDQGRLKAL